MAIKLRFQTKTKIWIEFDATDTRDAFHQLSNLQNVFEESQCGRCGGTDLRYRHSQAEKNGKHYDFYELHCQNPNCRAKLNFGQRMEDRELFPRRKGDDGEYLPNNGWRVYNPNRDEQADSFYE